MSRNRDFRQTSPGKRGAIQQSRGGKVGLLRPGIDPKRVHEERSPGWINNIRFAPEEVRRVAVGTGRIKIAVEGVASLVVGCFAARVLLVAHHQPSPRQGSVWRGIPCQLIRSTGWCS